MADNPVAQTKDFDFPAAWQALRALLKGQGDPATGARLSLALGARRWYRVLRDKIRAYPGGAELLAEKPAMSALLNDWEQLRQLPEGSVGREYLAWAEREQLTVQGLEEAVAPVFARMPTEELEFVRNRSRDLHDLFHVLTGYGRDSGGETALLVFSSIQHGNKSLRVLSWVGLLRSAFKGRFDIVRLRHRARHRARQAELLIAQPWHLLLDQPLDVVRAELGLSTPPQYRPFNASEVESIQATVS